MKRLDKYAVVVAALLAVSCAGALAQTPTAPQVTGQVVLPHDLSPWGMFLGADMVVKSVLVGLALASLVTWTIALVKVFEVRAASRQAVAATRRLKASATLADAHAALDGQRGVIAAMLASAADEVARSGPQLGADGIKERIAIALSRLEQAESRRLSRGTGVLATIGAIGPFVGLFGTVWGIMNSFIGISKAHTTNLAVVAPGIAEALLATAVGLAAAIPAVVVYNVFGRMTAAHKARVGDAASEIMRTVGRDLDRQAAFERDGTVRFAPAQAAE